MKQHTSTLTRYANRLNSLAQQGDVLLTAFLANVPDDQSPKLDGKASVANNQLVFASGENKYTVEPHELHYAFCTSNGKTILVDGAQIVPAPVAE